MKGKRVLAWLLIAVLGLLTLRTAKAADAASFQMEAYAFPYGSTATVVATVTGSATWVLKTADGEVLCKRTADTDKKQQLRFAFPVEAHLPRRTELALYRGDSEQAQCRTLLFCDAPQNGPVWQVACTERKLAITFDSANSSANTKEILDLLDRYDAKATFFLIGRFIENYPELCAEITARGHELASHSYEHPDMLKATSQEAYRSIVRTDALIRTYNGDTCTLYRPPSGQSTFRDRAIARGLESEVIRWSVDSGDGFRDKTYANIIGRRRTHLHNGGIALMHVYGKQTLQVLGDILPELTAQGYRFVTVSELLIDGEAYIDEWGTQQPLHHEQTGVERIANRLSRTQANGGGK
ncbi:MAG: polysaccharide deacetylase family protein [Clostridia bacterium]|nr:polysaccharide deacetylase family protein [Clostridia bacterium]